MTVHVEGCPLQHEKAHKAGDCRVCPQGEGCIFLIILKRMGDLDDKVRDIHLKVTS